jgi:hypothetical protein
MNVANLDAYRKHSAIPLHVLPGRNPFAPAVPFLKLAAAFGLGAVAMLMLLMVTP